MRASPLLTSAAIVASTAQAQVVQLDIAKHPHDTISRRAADASDAIDITIKNDLQNSGYYLTAQVGTPPQKITFLLDTGSSDVWMPSTGARACSRNPGCHLGSYDSSKSSTFDDVGKGLFEIAYVDQTSASGDYIQDVFQLGGETVQNLTMGLGLKTDINFGIVGVGFASNEASVARTGDSYPNLPVAMQQQGLINTIGYSLWLNDRDAKTGSILFGGIDKEQFIGDLTTLDLLPEPTTKAVSQFLVQMYSLEATSSSGSDSIPTMEQQLVAVLDSGTTLTFLPQDWAEQIWAEVGAAWNPANDFPLLPCSMRDSGGKFTFGFGGPNGPKIEVGMDELVFDLTDGQAPSFPSGPLKGEKVCEFGILNQTAPPYLLGDTFLRSAYVVYDLVNDQVAIAPTNFNATKTNVVPFPSHGAPIPSATAAKGPVGTAAPTGPKLSKFSAQKGFLEPVQSTLDKNSAGASLTAFSGVGMTVFALTMALALTAAAW